MLYPYILDLLIHIHQETSNDKTNLMKISISDNNVVRDLKSISNIKSFKIEFKG